MTRDEMLVVLRQLEEEFYDDANAAHEDGDRHYDDRARHWGDALHKAVKMLTPPSMDEIGWLRQLVASSRRCVAVKIRGEKDPPWVMRHGLERALDALAREAEHPLVIVDVVCACGAKPRQFAFGYHDAESPLPPCNATVPVFSCGACRDKRIADLEERERRARAAFHGLEVAVGLTGMPFDSREAINLAIDAVNDAFLYGKVTS